jgi:hypothetical protein
MWSWKTQGVRSLGIPNLTGKDALVVHEPHLGGWADSYCTELTAPLARGMKL